MVGEAEAILVSYRVDGACPRMGVDGYPRVMPCAALIVIVQDHETSPRLCFWAVPWNRTVQGVVACYNSRSSPLIPLFSPPSALSGSLFPVFRGR